MSTLALPTTADDILAALVKQTGDSIHAAELAFSQGARRCDFWTISANSSSGFKAIAYEIKVSRADFNRDSAIKQREARLFSDRFYYVTPVGLIRPDECPDWAGLIEFDGATLRSKIQAPLRDKDGPSWEFVVSLIRSSGNINRDADLLRQRALFAERTLAEVKRRLREAGLQPWEYGINS